MASSPNDVGRLELEKEFTAVFTSLERFNDAQKRLQTELATNISSLQAALLKHKPCIVHFSGHGAEKGGILLQDDKGSSIEVPPMALKNLFQILQKKFSINAVVLNACHSSVQAQAIAEHVPYVIGMKAGIYDSASIEFSRAFYMAMASENDDVVFAFDIACNNIALTGIEGDNIPVLYGVRND